MAEFQKCTDPNCWVIRLNKWEHRDKPRPPHCHPMNAMPKPKLVEIPPANSEQVTYLADIQRQSVPDLRARIGGPRQPTMQQIVEALGFDPTNHHNAALCPYCLPILAQALRAAANRREDADAQVILLRAAELLEEPIPFPRK